SGQVTIPGFNGVRFPCAKFTDEVTSSVQNILMTSFQTFSGLGFTPNVTVVNKQETFYVSGVTNDNTKVRWAVNSDCSNVVAEFVLSGFQFTTTVTVGRGIYHFCWDVSGTSTNFISLGRMSILKFSSLPRTAFVNKAVQFQLTDDSPW